MNEKASVTKELNAKHRKLITRELEYFRLQTSRGRKNMLFLMRSHADVMQAFVQRFLDMFSLRL